MNLLVILGICLLSLVYFIPAMVAISRQHVNAMAIFLTNLLFGWTVIGWAVALIWAFTNKTSHNASSGFSAKALILSVLGLAVVVTGMAYMIGMNVPKTAVVGSKPAAVKAAPAVKTGVPIPADQLFGQ
jgi:hypothetical protein